MARSERKAVQELSGEGSDIAARTTGTRENAQTMNV